MKDFNLTAICSLDALLFFSFICLFPHGSGMCAKLTYFHFISVGMFFFNKFSIETSLHLFPSANTIVSYGISLAGSELKVEFHIRTVRHSSLLSFHF